MEVLVLGKNSEVVTTLKKALEYLAIPYQQEANIKDYQKLNETGYKLLLIADCADSPGALEICRTIREINFDIFITYLANQNDPLERLLAFEYGVDQYAYYPITEFEARARLRSSLRRANSIYDLNEIQIPPVLQIEDLEINTSKMQVSIKEKPVNLTPSEYHILEFLAQNSGQTISKSSIAHKLWGYDSDVYEENIKYHISRIRKKIEIDPQNPYYLKTVRGLGYQMLSAK